MRVTHPRDARLAEVRRLVLAHRPRQPAATIARLGAGTDHAAFLVDDELVVRLATAGTPAERAAAVAREREVLAVAVRRSPLPVPTVVFADAARGCIAHRRLAGEPLLALPPARRAALAPPVARALGAFLAALHRVPAAELAAAVDVDVRPPATWRAEAAELLATTAPALPAPHRRAVQRFVRAAPPAAAFRALAPAFTHNDLGVEHVLVDPSDGRVTGVIDWSDAAVADPAADFARLLRDLGPPALDAALAAYALAPAGGVAALRARARFYARCLLLEDLAFGLETDAPPYVTKSLAALPWLFPSA